MSSVELASAYVSIIPTTKNIKGNLTKAFAGGDQEAAKAGKRQGGRFAGAFKAGIVGVGGALAAVGIGKFVTDAVRGAGELQQSIGAIESVFGKSSGKMQKWSANAAQNVGLTKNEFNELGTVLGAQLKNGGTAMDKLAPKTNKLIGMGADMAAMFGGTTKEAVEAVSAALRGERDTIEKYGVSLTQASVDAKAAELGFKKVGGALSQEATQAATVALIMEQTADAHGTFAKEADTFAGAQQRMTAQWGNLVTTVGGFVIPIMTKLFNYINETALPAIKNFGAWFRSDVLPVLRNIGSWISGTGLPALKSFGGWFVENGPTIAKWAGILTAVLLPVLGRLAVRYAMAGTAATVSSVKQVAAWVVTQAAAVKGAVVFMAQSYRIVGGWALMAARATANGIKIAAVWTAQIVRSAVVGAVKFGVQVARVVAGWTLMATRSLVMAARMAASWIIALGPIAWITAAVIAIVALVIANWDKIKKWTAKIWGAIVDWVVKAWRNVKKWTINLVTKVVKWITSKFNAFIKFNMRIWKKIWTTVRDAWNTVKRKTREILTAVVVWVLNKFREVRNTGRKLWNKITGIIGDAWAKVRDTAKRILRAVVVWVLNKFREVRDTGRKVWNKIKGLIGDTWDNIRDKAKRILRDLVIWVLNKFRDVRDKGREIWNKLKNIIGDVWGNIEKGLKRSWNFIRDKVFDPIKRAVGKIPNAFEKAKDGIGKAWSKLQSIAKKPVKFVVNRVINDGLIGTFNKIPGVNIPKIKLPRGFEKGGLAPKGWAMVGEEGPELVNFSNPGRVYTAKQTKAAMDPHAGGHGAFIGGSGGGYLMSRNNVFSRAGRMVVDPQAGWFIREAVKAWQNVTGIDVRAGAGFPRVNTFAGGLAGYPVAMTRFGPGGASIQFDNRKTAGWGKALKRGTAVHEIGHALGLPHVLNRPSVMDPMMRDNLWPNEADRNLLRGLYGKGSGKIFGSAAPVNPFMGFVSKMIDAIKERFPAGGMFIDAAIGIVTKGVGKVVDWVGDLAAGIGKKIAGVAGSVVEGIKGFFGFAAGGPGTLYDNGGRIGAGTTLVDNQSRKPEALLNSRQWSTAHRAMNYVQRVAEGADRITYAPIYQYMGEDPEQVARRDRLKLMDTLNAYGF